MGLCGRENSHLNGRVIHYSMGKVLGGGSSTNVLTWSRGHQGDWDFYASETGDASWSYAAVLDLYRRRIEAWALIQVRLPRRGRNGARAADGGPTPLRIRLAGRR